MSVEVKDCVTWFIFFKIFLTKGTNLRNLIIVGYEKQSLKGPTWTGFTQKYKPQGVQNPTTLQETDQQPTKISYGHALTAFLRDKFY